jgi:hypothetical protein
VLALLWLVLSLGGDMRVHFDELNPPPLTLDVWRIPYYTARTVLRMFITFAASLLFTFIWLFDTLVAWGGTPKSSTTIRIRVSYFCKLRNRKSSSRPVNEIARRQILLLLSP